MMKIVRFEDGTFGVRVGGWPYCFADLRTPGLCHAQGNRWFPHCTGSRAQAEAEVKARAGRPKMNYEILAQ